jgi:acetyl esterase
MLAGTSKKLTMRDPKVIRAFLSLTIVLNLFAVSAAEDQAKPTRLIEFKEIGDVSLNLHVFEPEGHKPTDKRSAIVFFFGGGWNGGSPSQFYPHGAHLAEKGVFATAAEYRVKSRNGTTPFECVKDGKSAVRYLRANATKLGIDPDHIAAGGGSAGGHVAAATATVSGLNESGEDASVGERPNALVLFNPVYDNGPKGYGHSRVKDRYKEISPFHNIRKGMPPAIVFLGTNDKLIPVATGEAFKKEMEDVGCRSELMLFDGAAHGFFNYGRGDGSDYRKTVAAMDKFLESLGYFAK